MADNFHIDVTSIGRANLDLAINLVFSGGRPAGGKAEAYGIHAEKGLVFFWTPNLSAHGIDIVRLPFKLDAAGAADFASRWLIEQDYGRQPDHDGDNEKGWRVYTEGWGMIESWQGSFVAIKPAWAMYGK